MAGANQQRGSARTWCQTELKGAYRIDCKTSSDATSKLGLRKLSASLLMISHSGRHTRSELYRCCACARAQLTSHKCCVHKLLTTLRSCQAQISGFITAIKRQVQDEHRRPDICSR